MKNNSGSSSSSGIGFLGLLQVAFIVLKLCHVIEWSWWLVFVPTWIGILVFVICFIALVWLLGLLSQLRRKNGRGDMMVKYISVDDLRAATTKRNKIWNTITDASGRGLDEIIDGLPSADVQPVVRCKDCKYFDSGTDEDGKLFFKCLGWVYGGTSEDDFCSHGERKDG